VKAVPRTAPGEMPPVETEPDTPRGWVARAFAYVEDALYAGLGLLLAGAAVALLVDGAVGFVRILAAGEPLQPSVVVLLDRLLLILMIVELLYTLQVSFREHALAPEPFLLVALVAVTRRILVITAEFAELMDKGHEAFRNAMIELGLLTVMIVALVISLELLKRRRAREASAMAGESQAAHRG
jgi:uncharacterized membrane protein (DUF373 family)